MILTKNLNNVFLETCKKNNLKKLVNIIEQASQSNVVLDYAEGFTKACRHGKLQVVQYLVKSTDLSTSAKETSLIYSVEYGQSCLFNYLVNSDKFLKDFKMPLDELFKASCLYDQKEVLIYLLIERKAKPSSEIVTYINTLPESFNGIKQQYHKIIKILELNKNLDENLNKNNCTNTNLPKI